MVRMKLAHRPDVAGGTVCEVGLAVTVIEGAFWTVTTLLPISVMLVRVICLARNSIVPVVPLVAPPV